MPAACSDKKNSDESRDLGKHGPGRIRSHANTPTRSHCTLRKKRGKIPTWKSGLSRMSFCTNTPTRPHCNLKKNTLHQRAQGFDSECKLLPKCRPLALFECTAHGRQLTLQHVCCRHDGLDGFDSVSNRHRTVGYRAADEVLAAQLERKRCVFACSPRQPPSVCTITTRAGLLH